MPHSPWWGNHSSTLLVYMFSRETLNDYVERGLISVQTHPNSKDVCIYNYTPQCQYSRAWDEVTTRCRGLIIDWRGDDMQAYKLLSNPLPKFFNWEEHTSQGKPIPDGSPIVYEKMDGWLGILYWLDGEPWIATRGSFASVGAVWATAWFREFIDWESIEDREWTHLFEIISPDTKIVVNYAFEGLVWLTARHLRKDIDVAITPAHMVKPLYIKKFAPKYYGVNIGTEMRRASRIEVNGDLDSLKAREASNEEGFVCAFPDGTRLKVKFAEYARLHKIITGVSEIGIWEMLRDGQPVNFDNVPDEFFNWVNDVQKRLRDSYSAIENEAQEQFHNIVVELSKGGTVTEGEQDITVKNTVTRKDAALLIQKMTNPGIGFAMLDKKDYSQTIWKMIRPRGASVFKKDD